MDAMTARPPLWLGAWRSLAWLGGAVATLVAGATAAILAVFFTAALAVVALMGMIVVAFTAMALRAKRTGAGPADPDLIEARHIGGHSWVAYGWDGDGRKA